MDSMGDNIQHRGNGRGAGLTRAKAKGTGRRTWSRVEEQALICALKELIANGWKSDNGFRCGYLGQLESKLAELFPTAGIKGNKHVNSKLTVWKKVYGQVCGMKNTSGFGWNEDELMISVDSDEVWNTYVLHHSEVATYRTKSFPYFNDWVEIFGNDRAAGLDSQFFTDAIFDLEHPHNRDDGPSTRKSGEKHPFDVSDDSDGEINTKTSTSSKGQGKDKGKRRKSTEPSVHGSQGPLVDLLGNYLQDANSTLEKLALSITAGNNIGSTRSKNVWDTIMKMEGLETKVKVFIHSQICKEAQKMDMFMGLNEEGQHEFIQMVLNNQI